jgi:hypothetical protein
VARSAAVQILAIANWQPQPTENFVFFEPVQSTVFGALAAAAYRRRRCVVATAASQCLPGMCALLI